VNRGWSRARPRAWHVLLILLFAPPLLHAAGTDEQVTSLLLIVAAMLAVGKLLGEGAERLGFPAVLGELAAGLVLGPGLLGVVPAPGEATYGMIRVLAELGVILLLFEVGLEVNLREMFKVGTSALAVGAVGVMLPLVVGFLYWSRVPHPVLGDGGDLSTVAIFIGATLTATSVGITARVLGDMGQMETPEARIILGAAVIDDVLGLVILGVVTGIAEGGAITISGVASTLGAAVAFLVIALVLGNLLMPRLADRVLRMRARGVVVVLSFSFALALAATAARVGSALIIGAFAAGLILKGTPHAHTVEEQVRPVAAVLAPIFFVSVGAAADLSLLDPRAEGAGGLLLLAGTLTVIAVATKLVAGWAAPWSRFQRLTVGVGMVPRGEVGLIFADVGRQAGLLGDTTFGAVLLMVMATTFLAPIGLRMVFGREKPR
jgi:Na+:H+ antiporter